MTQLTTRRLALSVTVAGALFAAPTTLLAAGFYIQEQGVTGLGRAYAGEAAAANDASTIYFNPAGMTRLESGELQANVHLLMPRTRMSDQGSSASGGTFGEQAISGGSGGNPYDPTPVPNLYWAERYGERLWLGMGLTAPFGLGNDYDDDFFGRYDSTDTDLKVINLHPSVAFELSERVSIGGGLDLHYASATLRSAIPSPITGPDPDTDGEFKLEGDSWDVGFNLGLQADLTDATRLGLHYRHGVRQNLRGTATITPPAGTGGDTLTMSAQAALKLPNVASVALSHEFDSRWTGLVQYTWFRWSNFDEIDVRGGGGSIQTLEQHYRDSHAIALGTEYQASPRWTLRAGIQYDRTPTRDGFRSTRTPDGDRTWYTVGASYRASDRFSFDFGYAYIDIGNESIELESEFANVGVSTETRARTRGDVHVLSAGLRYRF